MNTVVIYYSYTGKTRMLAEAKAKELGSKLYEIKEKKSRSVLNAYILGSLAARKQKASETVPISIDFADCERILLAAPIWAGYPAPAMNSIINLLPEGKQVELFMTSGSGNSSGSKQKTEALILKKGCTVKGYHDIRASEIK